MSKVVLITGASTGFGRDTAETLAKSGSRVFASMRGTNAKNLEHANALRAAGIDVVELDVTDAESVDKAITEVLSRAGRIDVLVNNAGVASTGLSEAITPEQASALFDVNVIGLHRVTRAVLPILRRQRDGLIINIGSVVGRVTLPSFGIYGASKFAVEALTDSYRYEVSQLGVDVVLVQPSAHGTELYSNASQPTHGDRTAEYGEASKIPNALASQFMTIFQGENAPDTHAVSETILDLIETSKGSRPVRTIVGPPFGADALNEAAAPVQSGVLKALGFEHLEVVADS